MSKSDVPRQTREEYEAMRDHRKELTTSISQSIEAGNLGQALIFMLALQKEMLEGMDALRGYCENIYWKIAVDFERTQAMISAHLGREAELLKLLTIGGEANDKNGYGE